MNDPTPSDKVPVFSRSTRCVFILLIVFGLLAYANAIFHPFVHDDLVFIRYNPRIHELNNWGEFFLRSPDSTAISPLVNAYYRPVLEIVYRLEYRLFGFNPAGYHLVNVLLHIINSMLVYALAGRFIRRSSLALGAAVLFLLHPVQTEAVACISGISNLLAALLGLGCLLLLCDESSRGWTWKNWAASGLFVLGLFTKEMLIILPAVVVLYKWCWGRRYPSWKATGGLVIGAFLYLSWRTLIIGRSLPGLFDYPQELFLRLLAIPQTLLMYLRIIFWPLDLHYYRSVDVARHSAGDIVLWVIMLALFGALVRWLCQQDWRTACRQNAPVFVWGGGFFLLTLLPVANILPLIHEYSLIAAFDHFLYWPSVGLFIALAAGVDHLAGVYLQERKENVLKILLLIFIAVATGLTVYSNTFWRGEVALFERTVRFEPDLARARILLGKAYYFNRDYTQAIREYEAALVIMQRYHQQTKLIAARDFYQRFINEIYFDLAHCYEARADWAKSNEMYFRSLEGDPSQVQLHNNIGVNYLRMNDLARAREHFQRAVDFNPRDVMALTNLAVCIIEENDPARGAKILEKVLVIDPAFVPARQNLDRLRQFQSTSVP